MQQREGVYFVQDNRVDPPTWKPHLAAICYVSFDNGAVTIVPAVQAGVVHNGVAVSFPATRAPDYETFEDRHAFRTPQGEVLLIWPTAENFRTFVDHALADISTGDYAFPSEAELATDEGRQHFLRQFVEA